MLPLVATAAAYVLAPVPVTSRWRSAPPHVGVVAVTSRWRTTPPYAELQEPHAAEKVSYEPAVADVTASPPPPLQDTEDSDSKQYSPVPVPLFYKGGGGDSISPDTFEDDDHDDARRVLLIYTGGTLGMTKQPDGSLAPERGSLPNAIRLMPEMQDPSTPEIDIIEYDPLIDSSNVTPEDWARLATQIRDNYYEYDGFVIAHGTDTMAYTASALSFMLEGLVLLFRRPNPVTVLALPVLMMPLPADVTP